MNRDSASVPACFNAGISLTARTLNVKQLPECRRLAILRTDDSEERIGCIIEVIDLTANVVPSSLIVTLMMEEIRSSETSVLTRVTRRNIEEGGNLHNHRRENLKSYIALTGWVL
jgi:hypothetical protein